jgi:hypothetical protein
VDGRLLEHREGECLANNDVEAVAGDGQRHALDVGEVKGRQVLRMLLPRLVQHRQRHQRALRAHKRSKLARVRRGNQAAVLSEAWLERETHNKPPKTTYFAVLAFVAGLFNLFARVAVKEIHVQLCRLVVRHTRDCGQIELWEREQLT